jgi:hypothetical protein
MFSDMGTLPLTLYDSLVTATIAYLEQAIPAGEYLGWLASAANAQDAIVAGAGVLLRWVPPHPPLATAQSTVALGRQGVVLNVFTERAWRRRGLARLLMDHEST